MKALTRITLNPEIMDGKPCIRQMRVTGGTIVGLIPSKRTIPEILKAYPTLKKLTFTKPFPTSRRYLGRCPTTAKRIQSEPRCRGLTKPYQDSRSSSNTFMIKLPNGDQAQLDDKLDRYVLNPQHPKGKDKATLFKNRLGITLENKEILENTLLNVALNHEATIHKQDNYGIQYDIKFLMMTEIEKSLAISCWIIRAGEDFPRLTNAYPVTK